MDPLTIAGALAIGALTLAEAIAALLAQGINAPAEVLTNPVALANWLYTTFWVGPQPPPYQVDLGGGVTATVWPAGKCCAAH